MSLRVGVDVGGTFTKAVAVQAAPFALAAHAVVPTTHHAADGVAHGVAHALDELLVELGPRASEVELVAFSTTQAMNALLEGDVPRVGVIGLGAEPDLRAARKRTCVGDVALAPGRTLGIDHAFLDITHGLDDALLDRTLEDLRARGCGAVAVSGAFSVDENDAERRVAERARELGLPTCAGHELTSVYGLELRTVSAALNAAILPLMERTVAVVGDALAKHRLHVPLLVLRGDGGAMSLDAFKAAPSFSIGAGPAAGAAAALHDLALSDGIVLECGGTSSNVSIVSGGRTVLRSLKVMGRPTAIRSVDSWVVGAAGGSMPRLNKRKIAEVGPRSAHVAGLRYACFSEVEELMGAQVELIAPREGDTEVYAALRCRDGSLRALTATCAANALGLVDPGAHCAGSRGAALLGFTALGERLKCSAEKAAQGVLDAAVSKIAHAVAEAAKAHELPKHVPVVALGGSGAALAPEVARRLGRPLVMPEHPEILSSIGAALSLVRAECVRTATGMPCAAALAIREAEQACAAAGAAPNTIRSECRYVPEENVLRAVATGAVALESGAAGRAHVDEPAQHRNAALALGVHADTLQLVSSNAFYRVYCENGSGPVAVVDHHGSVALAERARRVLTGKGEELVAQLREAVEESTLDVGVGAMLPRVAIVSGPRIVDASEAHKPEDIVELATEVLRDDMDPSVAVVWR